MSSQSSNNISQINQEEIKWKIQRIESLLSSASQEIDSAKVMLLSRFKRYPEGFKETRLRLLGIATFSIPLILGIRDFPELAGMRPYLLLLIAAFIGCGILVYFIYEYWKKIVNSRLDEIEMGYTIVNHRIYIAKGLVLSYTYNIQDVKSQTLDFLYDLAWIVIMLRIELLNGLKNASKSKLFSNADKGFLTGSANVLDGIMKKIYSISYKPKEEQFNKLLLKFQKPKSQRLLLDCSMP